MAPAPRTLLLAAAGLVALAGVHAAVPSVYPPVHARGGKLWQDILAREAEEDKRMGILRNSTANYFSQLIFHNNPANTSTFQQKYYYDTSFWTGAAGAPVYLYISGEGPCGGTPGGDVAAMASSTGGMIVTMEHRYYGASLPSALTDEETFKTLSVDNEIADLASFLTYFLSHYVPNPTSHPVIVVGGSYAGALSAWFREKHPELAAMSWSSSGVVNAVYNFVGFDQQIVEDLPLSCAATIRSAMAAAEANWADPTKKPALLQMFNTPDYFLQTDFMWMLADSVAMGPQYGAKAALCTTMLGGPDPLTQLATWTNTHYGTSFGSSCYYSTVCLSDPTYASQWPNQRPWVYQCCTEVAFW